ncbi:Gfo/Idh/MocA family protein [Tautonia plasticadhaerens]|uniref:Putative oxidoreductase YdgJ n=1 Tax=Tautonia plasticadhaerens TaxID=2527974 RepID=A0A518HFV1_9BACT|nr:Gfo/Idh/MocA family oxidoreductase [Tautonia plasticadhaerens]QDV39699.1 putative oxidoreductase YdgJ [Tautonia plasticadhaerens]
MSVLKVGVVGCGYWGPNLIRNISASPLSEVVAVCDADPSRLERIGKAYSQLKLCDSLDRMLEVPLDAVAIATPVSTHHALASRCLEAGLHVLVEKPLAASAAEAWDLVELAERKDRVLMVDHTYLFHGAVRKIKEVVESGELGELYYVDSIRINLGLFQHDINVIWDLAPHDLSIVEYVLGREARSISAWGCAHADREIEDIAYVNVDYDDRMLANFHVNWLSPVKIRQMIFAGSRKSLVFNELNATEPIKVYDRGVDFGAEPDERRRMLVNYRSGDVWSPYIEPTEALRGVVTHFAECIRDDRTPLSDGRLGLRVVRLLESATRSIRAQGGRIVLSGGSDGIQAGSNGAQAHGGTAARAERPGERDQDRPRRPSRKQRDHSLLR